VNALHVKTRFIEGLLDDLPGAGLAGVQVADDVVRVDVMDGVDPALGDPEDLQMELGWYADRLGIDGMLILPRHTFQEVIVWCGHDWSLTGAEGPIVELQKRGRPWPILWTCDICGATVLDDGDGWTR
jgi:hypothetical protein